MNSPRTPVKRMNLGVDDLDTQLAAAKDVAKDSNIPRQVFPSDIAPAAEDAAPTQTPEPSNLKALATPRKARGPIPAPVRRFSVDLPEYVHEHIAKTAYHTKHTKKRVVLEAFKAGGIDIKDIDIEKEGDSHEE